MARITFLGTGSADSEVAGEKSSILLEGAGTCLLLDAGEPCTQRISEEGISPTRPDAVFVSHAHADHISGLPLLLQANRLSGRDRPLALHLPAHTIDPLRIWMKALGIDPDNAGYPLELLALQSDQAIPCGNLKVTPFSTTHDCKEDRESFGFVVAGPHRQLIYSSDLGSASDLLPALTTNARILICEMAHIDPESLITVLQEYTLELLVLTHFSADNSRIADDIRRELDKKLPLTSEVLLACRGESFSI